MGDCDTLSVSLYGRFTLTGVVAVGAIRADPASIKLLGDDITNLMAVSFCNAGAAGNMENDVFKMLPAGILYEPTNFDAFKVMEPFLSDSYCKHIEFNATVPS
jgi:hypothetical protein